jgi:hypothetical protein
LFLVQASPVVGAVAGQAAPQFHIPPLPHVQLVVP